MKLTLDQISAITRGAVRIEERDDKICFFRFTKEQEEIYKETRVKEYINKYIKELQRHFDVSDRIKLFYHSDSTLVNDAIAEHQKYIQEQVLAVELSVSSDLTHAKTEELGDSVISFDIQKA